MAAAQSSPVSVRCSDATDALEGSWMEILSLESSVGRTRVIGTAQVPALPMLLRQEKKVTIMTEDSNAIHFAVPPLIAATHNNDMHLLDLCVHLVLSLPIHAR